MQIIQVLALLALASSAMAQTQETTTVPLAYAPLLRCLPTYTFGNSIAVEVNLNNIQTECGARRFQSFTVDVSSSQGRACYTQVIPDQNKMVASLWIGPVNAAQVPDSIIAPWSCPLGLCNASPLPCGTTYTITVTNEDKQSNSITCATQTCPSPPPVVASPPPCVASPPPVVASPPPCVASPPPVVYSPPPCVASPPPVTVASPPPCVASPPPYVCSPPPVTVASPPPCVASPPPYVCSPPPVTVKSPPPCVASPPPYCQSPVTVSSPPPYCQSPVTVKSPPPYCQSPVTVKSPPPYCQSPVTVSSPPPYCQSPVTVSKPPPYCAPVKAPKPSCGVNHWGKPVYCSGKKKCCTVTVNQYYGKKCVKTTKKQCLNKCPGHSHKWW